MDAEDCDANEHSKRSITHGKQNGNVSLVGKKIDRKSNDGSS